MLGVGVGDGIANRLCCALVVVEKIRGFDGEFLSISSFVSETATRWVPASSRGTRLRAPELQK